MTQQKFPQYAGRRPQPRYPLIEAAEARQAERDKFKPYVAIALAIAIVIAFVGVFIVMSDSIAARAGATQDKAPVPSAQAGPRIPQPARNKPTEKSPPVAEIIAGDGTWLLGKEIKSGTYESFTGPTCYWARLSDLSGEYEGTIASGFGRTGKQRVAIAQGDRAFVSQGCGEWVMVR